MLARHIVWILAVSGAITAGGGLAAFLTPHLFLRLGFGVDRPESASLFSVRTPVLVAGATEKFAIGIFAFFGPLKRTSGMTAIAIVDGIFAVLYVVYLAGL